MNERPFAPACERNKEPILAVLREHFADRRHVLEIGSGTGQHAVHFAANLPHLEWQTSDRAENLPGVRAWLAYAALPNTPAPLELDVTGEWPSARFDAVFSANTLHIMSWDEVQTFFARLADVLAPHAVLAIYGPFRYGGRHTSDSNAAFEASLKAAAPHRAIRDFEAVDALAQGIGLKLLQDHTMPANNRCLVWRTAR
ncbi:MAG: class I SAM-dependent methyltransferase [Zoogloeaceae bacterium]|nr:class I SAM-dependent methyltransferase [Zoogloeaceae bacterium]